MHFGFQFEEEGKATLFLPSQVRERDENPLLKSKRGHNLRFRVFYQLCTKNALLELQFFLEYDDSAIIPLSALQLSF